MVGKASMSTKKKYLKGYIAMIVVNKNYRGNGLAKKLVIRFINDLKKIECQEISLETECINIGALALYKSFFK